MSREWKYAVVDLSTNSTTVSDVPCIVKGFYVNTTMSAHECLIKMIQRPLLESLRLLLLLLPVI